MACINRLRFNGLTLRKNSGTNGAAEENSFTVQTGPGMRLQNLAKSGACIHYVSELAVLRVELSQVYPTQLATW